MLAQSRSLTARFRKASADRLAALGRVREWTRARFKLSEETTILVSEIACGLPGCPPLETVIAFWIDGRRYHFKIFKPVAEVRDDDLPPTWLLPSLAVPEDFECECC